ncbi:MAG: hypothetical protein JXX29_07065 [Deltaproteobacteria bacterium]|nr:hypothetical protein [Deltaproteobacteria bacterium]MBN2671414.1 hypothetical protein [Deltaproteobacteria bacterium]
MKSTFAWFATGTRPTLTAAVFSLFALHACNDDMPAEPVTSSPAVARKHLEDTSTSRSSVGDQFLNKDITELTSLEFLRQWELVQQNNDFPGYESLYATRFDGIEKKNDVTFRFVRDQWLHRQETTFQSLRNVRTENVSVQVLPGISTIQMTYKATVNDQQLTQDKTIVLVTEDNTIRIATESTSQKSSHQANNEKQKQQQKLLKDFYLVLDDRYIVFSQSSLDKKGALFVNESTAIKPVRKEEMKKQFRRLIKKKFIVGFEDGSTEILRVTSARAIARYQLHSGARSYWVDKGYTEVEMGEALWEMADQSDSVYLTGMLKSSRKGALWATPMKSRPPEVYLSQKLNRSEIANIRKRMRRRKDYKILQQAFSDAGHSKQWTSYEPQATARMYKSPKGNRRFASATISAGKGCGDFFGSLLGFYHVQKGVLFDLGYPTDFFQDPFIDNRDAIQAIDIDHDGIPEFLGHNKLMYKIDDDWFVYEIRIPKADCPC